LYTDTSVALALFTLPNLTSLFHAWLHLLSQAATPQLRRSGHASSKAKTSPPGWTEQGSKQVWDAATRADPAGLPDLDCVGGDLKQHTCAKKKGAEKHNPSNAVGCISLLRKECANTPACIAFNHPGGWLKSSCHAFAAQKGSVTYFVQKDLTELGASALPPHTKATVSSSTGSSSNAGKNSEGFVTTARYHCCAEEGRPTGGGSKRSGTPPLGLNGLWANTPGADWTEAYPVGNGALGGLVSGEPWRARISLSEETLFSLAETVTARRRREQTAEFAGRERRLGKGKGSGKDRVTTDDLEWGWVVLFLASTPSFALALALFPSAPASD
jgi:hypothetical protein